MHSYEYRCRDYKWTELFSFTKRIHVHSCQPSTYFRYFFKFSVVGYYNDARNGNSAAVLLRRRKFRCSKIAISAEFPPLLCIIVYENAVSTMLLIAASAEISCVKMCTFDKSSATSYIYTVSGLFVPRTIRTLGKSLEYNRHPRLLQKWL